MQWWEYIVAVLPVDDQWNEWDIEYSDEFLVQEEIEQPISKEYLVKAYDKSFTFLKVIPASIITNDITFSETINGWQWELVLNLNLPIDTDYLDDIKYIRVYVNSNNWLSDKLLYTWYLSKYSRLFSNNKENVQATFLSLFSLLSEVYYKDSNWDTAFTIENTDIAQVIRDVIDYFWTIYPWLLSYTNESIIDYWSNINIDVFNQKCSEIIKNLLKWTDYYLFVWADGVVQFKPKPSTISHYFTYEKDITELTIPQDFEQIINAVKVSYTPEWEEESYTSRQTNAESISKHWRKEDIIDTKLTDSASALWYASSYLQEYSEWKQNVSITINNRYLIESIHPWDTIKIRNLWLNISWLKISKVKYKYEQATIQLEYQTTLAEQIFQN